MMQIKAKVEAEAEENFNRKILETQFEDEAKVAGDFEKFEDNILESRVEAREICYQKVFGATNL